MKAPAKKVLRPVKAPAKAKVAAKKPIKKIAKANPVVAKKLVAKAVAKPPVKKVELAKPVAPKAKAVVIAKPVVKAKATPVQIKPEPYQMAQVSAVATNQKPRKSQIGLGVRELEHFADLLLAKRRELVGDMSSMEREALRSGSASNLSTLPMHMADMGTDNYEQEFTLGLVEKDRNLLREINHALAKIQNGTYGICEGTGIAIGKFRLEAQPWARFSIEYARQKEKNGMGVRTF